MVEVVATVPERVKCCNAVCVLQGCTVTPCVISILTYKRSAFCIDMRNIALDVLAEQVSGVVVAETCNAVHAVQVVQPGRCVVGCSAFCNKVSVIVTIATLYPAVAVLSTVVL